MSTIYSIAFVITLGVAITAGMAWHYWRGEALSYRDQMEEAEVYASQVQLINEDLHFDLRAEREATTWLDHVCATQEEMIAHLTDMLDEAESRLRHPSVRRFVDDTFDSWSNTPNPF